MGNKRMHFKVSVVALAAVLGMTAVAGEITDRFVYVDGHFGDPKRMEDVRKVARTAAANGYTGLVIQGDIQYAWRFNEAQREELGKLKRVCDEVGIEIIPAVWSIGYGGLSAADPNLAEGIPCRDIPYAVSADGRKAVYESASADVPCLDGGFENAKDLGDGRFKVSGLDFAEKPGEISFIDRRVKHSGNASLRFECSATDPKHRHARAQATLKIKPYSRYVIGMWWKTEGVNPVWALQATYYNVAKPGEGGGMVRQLSFTNPRIGSTGDWTYMTSDLSSLEYDRINLWFGSWGAKEGRFWVDDISIRVAGLENVIRREGCPFEVKGAANGIVYEEGRDYAPVPPMGAEQRKMPRENGSIVLSIQAGSRIRPGEKLLVSGYRQHLVGSSQNVACMSVPRLYELIDRSAACLAETVRPKRWFLPLDEIRAGGNCTLCADPRHGMPDLFVNCVTRMRGTIRKYTPEAKIYMWGDMLNPKMNGKAVQLMCKGSFEGSIDRIPKDIVIMHWGEETKDALRYFRGHGFETARSLSAVNGELTEKKSAALLEHFAAVRADPNCHAVMYTSWSDDYRNLARFAELSRKGGK